MRRNPPSPNRSVTTPSWTVNVFQQALSMEDPHNPGKNLIPTPDWDRIAIRLGLTERERDVARMLFEGHTRRQIASRIHCSFSTVRLCIDQLFDKLDVFERVGVVLRIVRVWLEIKEQS